MRPLTFMLLLIFAAVVYSVATAAVLDDKTITLSDDEAKACKAGCLVITKESAETLLNYIELLKRQVQEAKGKSCA